jgi:hypothetical protein
MELSETTQLRESMTKDVQNTEELVKQVLEEDVEARNNDKWLILMIWQKMQGIKVFIPYQQVNDLIPAETITRCRRKIQNTNGEYLPTDPDVIKKRNIKQAAILNWVRS